MCYKLIMSESREVAWRRNRYDSNYAHLKCRPKRESARAQPLWCKDMSKVEENEISRILESVELLSNGYWECESDARNFSDNLRSPLALISIWFTTPHERLHIIIGLSISLVTINSSRPPSAYLTHTHNLCLHKTRFPSAKSGPW